MSKFGVIHYNWPEFSFEQYLAFAAKSGYTHVELMLKDVCPDLDEKSNFTSDVATRLANARKARQLVESHGLKISALGAGNDFVQTDESVIVAQVERMRGVCEILKELGDDTVVRSEGGNLKDDLNEDQQWEAMYQCFSRCGSFLEELDATLAVDNHGLVTNDGDRLHAMLTRLNHSKIGANLDTMNFRWAGNSIEDCNRFYEILAPLTKHVHFKDGTGSRDTYIGAAFGDGEIDLQHALACLKKAGYNGVYTAEYEGPEAAEGVGYAKCAQWMKQNID